MSAKGQQAVNTWSSYPWAIIRGLIDGEQFSQATASEFCGCNRSHGQKIMRMLHKHGIVYIAKYAPAEVRGQPTMVYALKDRGQEDVERPERIDNKIACLRYRTTKKVLAGEVRLGVWGL